MKCTLAQMVVGVFGGCLARYYCVLDDDELYVITTPKSWFKVCGLPPDCEKIRSSADKRCLPVGELHQKAAAPCCICDSTVDHAGGTVQRGGHVP